MSLRYALLGLLVEKPATGYQLHQQFKEKRVYFWHAHHTQIYRELNRMEADEWVTSEVIPQEDLPDKKVYTVTETGRKELTNWVLHEASHPPNIKDEFLVRVAAFHTISTEQAIQLLQEIRTGYQYGVEQTRQWRNEQFGNQLPSPQEIGDYLTSEYGVRYTQTWVEWCDWAIETLKQLKEEGPCEK